MWHYHYTVARYKDMDRRPAISGPDLHRMAAEARDTAPDHSLHAERLWAGKAGCSRRRDVLRGLWSTRRGGREVLDGRRGVRHKVHCDHRDCGLRSTIARSQSAFSTVLSNNSVPDWKLTHRRLIK